jgi:hypothetical protein
VIGSRSEELPFSIHSPRVPFYTILGTRTRLRVATRKLRKHAALLRSWRRSGGTLAYYVTIHGEAAIGFSVAPDLLSDIGRLGVELGIEALRARQRS